MDFDHVRGVKFRTITAMLGYARERILTEIAKCDLVCACCHRLRTASRRKAKKHTKRQTEFYSRTKELKSAPCMDCGVVRLPAAMDFDHVQGAKFLDLARMSQMSWELVVGEIAKCDVVCANCHRVRTRDRRRRGVESVAA